MSANIIEAAARAMMVADWNHEYGPTPEWEGYCRDYPDDAEIYRILARAATPLIRADALEEAAVVAENHPWGCPQIGTAIRALKEKPRRERPTLAQESFNSDREEEQP